MLLFTPVLIWGIDEEIVKCGRNNPLGLHILSLSPKTRLVQFRPQKHRFQYPVLSPQPSTSQRISSSLSHRPPSLVPHLPSLEHICPCTTSFTTYPEPQAWSALHQHLSLLTPYPPASPTMHIPWPLDKRQGIIHLFSPTLCRGLGLLEQGTQPRKLMKPHFETLAS